MEKISNRLIVFANQKGGVGKTTLCMLFASYLADRKKKVLVVDADLQRSIYAQRETDLLEYGDDVKVPYNVQAFQITNPENVQKLMDTTRQLPGTVLFDSPGNISEDGLLPMFLNADAIVCPYLYDGKTLNSTGVFIQVITKLKARYPQMTAQLVFMPNRIDARVGTRRELDMWRRTDDLFRSFGVVTPRIASRQSITRVDSINFTNDDRNIVKPAFDFLYKKLY